MDKMVHAVICNETGRLKFERTVNGDLSDYYTVQGRAPYLESTSTLLASCTTIKLSPAPAVDTDENQDKTIGIYVRVPSA